MGLVKALSGAAGGALADQWREFFYCEALTADILAAKGTKRTSSRRSSNVKGEENIISNGAVVAVNDGQCMMIVEQGKVMEVCAEPGQFVWDSSTEPSIFFGGLGQGIRDTFHQIGRRFTLGGDTGKDQRIYYFNTKEIIGNKYGTPNPVPFRVVDQNIGLDIDIAIRCHGEYSYKITNPLLFYTNVCGNIERDYHRVSIDSQLKSELMTALQPAFARISAMGIRYSALPGHTTEMAQALNDELSHKWGGLRGLEVASFGISTLKASEEDESMIKELQKSAVLKNPTMAAATLTAAQAAAMQAAAKNEGGGGAFMAFAGMNMAANAAGSSASNLFSMGQNQPQQPTSTVYPTAENGGFAQTGKASAAWTCACGRKNEGAFCTECGAQKPALEGWACPACGTVNRGKFCMECGAKKPADAPLYQCDKCGWKPEDPYHPPKFCQECGDRFDDDDIQK